MVTHSARDLILKAAEYDFEVLAITNHNQMDFSRELSSFAASKGILLIPGVEATLEGRHLLLYNFLNYRPGWTIQDVRRSKGAGQLVIAPHPFYPVRTALREKFFEWSDLIDAVEINSLYFTGLNFNRRAIRVARHKGLPLVGNSDLHFLFQVGRTYSLIDSEKDLPSVLRAIRESRVEVVSRGGGMFYLLSWFLTSFRNRLRYRISGEFSQAEARRG